MSQNWFERIKDVLTRRIGHWERRRSRFHRAHGVRPTHRFGAVPAIVAQLETLEPRRLLSAVAATSNVVAANLVGSTLYLLDISSLRTPTGDNFTLSYTATQIVLTGKNGTEFKVGSSIESSYTLSITNPISISMNLNRNANSVTLTGNGTASLNNLSVFLGPGRQSNSLTMTDVIAQSVSVTGGGASSAVTFNQCQIKRNLWVDLGFSTGDQLNLNGTTITGNTTDRVGQFNVNQTTFNGTLTDLQLGRYSLYNSTDSTYVGTVFIQTGRNSVINYLYSPNGPNHIKGRSTFLGVPGHNTQIYQGLGSKTNNISASIIEDFPGHLIHTDEHVVPVAANSAPTVNSLAAATTTPTITGTYTPGSSTIFNVIVNGVTYTLGTSPQLTSPSAGKWSLNLTGSPLPTSTTSFTVTAQSYDKWGNFQTASGTVSNQQASIDKYLTAQNLNSSDVETSSGLNYVITTKGLGALPKAGQTVAAQYTGHILNSDGTLGSEFDSNVDGTHPTDPNPFKFVLGAGNVIKGWDEAFALLPVGSSATLLIPSALGYGTTGSGSSIPPNSILVFTVKVISAT